MWQRGKVRKETAALQPSSSSLPLWRRNSFSGWPLWWGDFVVVMKEIKWVYACFLRLSKELDVLGACRDGTFLTDDLNVLKRCVIITTHSSVICNCTSIKICYRRFKATSTCFLVRAVVDKLDSIRSWRILWGFGPFTQIPGKCWRTKGLRIEICVLHS